MLLEFDQYWELRVNPKSLEQPHHYLPSSPLHEILQLEVNKRLELETMSDYFWPLTS